MKLTKDEMTFPVQFKGGPGSGIRGHRTESFTPPPELRASRTQDSRIINIGKRAHQASLDARAASDQAWRTGELRHHEQALKAHQKAHDLNTRYASAAHIIMPTGHPRAIDMHQSAIDAIKKGGK